MIYVAPSFADYEIISEPFDKKGKPYVRVRSPKTAKERDVRSYTADEFRKLYGKDIPEEEEEDYPKPFPMMKHARGFDKGPILVIRNNGPRDEAFLRQSVARYAVGIGWYIASEDTFPEDAPPHLKYLLLSFDEFKRGDDFHMKRPSEIEKILDEKARKGEWFNIGKLA